MWTGSLEADLSVKLRVTTQTGLDAERAFFVKGWKGGQLASTKQPYHTSLHRATQQLLEEMVRAILELVKRGEIGEIRNHAGPLRATYPRTPPIVSRLSRLTSPGDIRRPVWLSM